MAKAKLYVPPKVLGVTTSPDLTKCMQNTGGIQPRSTFRIYRQQVVPQRRTLSACLR